MRIRHYHSQEDDIYLRLGQTGLSIAALGVYAAACAYASHAKSDGEVSRYAIALATNHQATEELVAELVESGWMECTGAGDYLLSGFRTLNGSSAETVQKRVAAGKASGVARRNNRPAEAQNEHMLNTCSTHVQQTGTHVQQNLNKREQNFFVQCVRFDADSGQPADTIVDSVHPYAQIAVNGPKNDDLSVDDAETNMCSTRVQHVLNKNEQNEHRPRPRPRPIPILKSKTLTPMRHQDVALSLPPPAEPAEAVAADDSADRFDAMWAAHPSRPGRPKVGRAEALRWWTQASAARRQAAYERHAQWIASGIWSGDDARPAPDLARFLADTRGRYSEAPEMAPAPAGGARVDAEIERLLHERDDRDA